MSYFVELTPEEITDILSDGKLHGVYSTALNEFVESGKQNAVIDLTDGVFKGKSAATVSQSFKQNAEKMKLEIQVTTRNIKGKDGTKSYVILSQSQ